MDDRTTTVAQLRELMTRFVADRQWQRYHDPKNLSMSIAIEAAELMEHFQWLRSEELGALKGDEKQMAQIREELADVLAYAVSLANTLDIDLSAALEAKMAKNEAKYPPEEFRGRYRKGDAERP